MFAPKNVMSSFILFRNIFYSSGVYGSRIRKNFAFLHDQRTASDLVFEIEFNSILRGKMHQESLNIFCIKFACIQRKKTWKICFADDRYTISNYIFIWL